ncbi:N-acetyltransferase family protein [Rhodocyclaceae bacterium SMB388]
MIDARNYRVTETLRNGVEICIRSSRPDDTDRLVEAFHKLDPETIHMRFFAPKKELSAADLHRFRETDFRTRVILLGTVQCGEREVVIALGSYARFEDSSAEVAFVVEEDYHGLGIARLLIGHLGTIASDAGVRKFTAETLPQNAAMLAVFERCGWPMQVHTDDGVVHVKIDLGGDRAA